MNPVRDPTGLAPLIQQRREHAAPNTLTSFAPIDGAAGLVRASGDWIGLAAVVTNPPNPSTALIVLDVWIEKDKPFGAADFSVPLGERCSVAYSKFAYVLRVVGAPPLPFDLVTIVGGFVSAGFHVPNYVQLQPAAGIAANVVVTNTPTVVDAAAEASLASIDTNVQTLVEAASPAAVSRAAVTAVDSVALPLNAARRGGVILNMGSETVVLNFGAAAVFATHFPLAPNATFSLKDALLVLGRTQDVHAICDAGKTSTLAIVELT